jgi:hypothetical protein
MDKVSMGTEMEGNGGHKGAVGEQGNKKDRI